MTWGDNAPRIKTKSAPSGLRKWNRKAHKDGKMLKVFAHSMSDIFDLKVPDEWREEEFKAWRNTTNIWFLVLTKRPSFPRRYNYPFEKVWLGTSIGDNNDISMAHRIVENLAHLYWISYEPAIGALDVSKLPKEIKWVVIGGESGKLARPFQLEWAFDTLAACRELGISIFVKQLGANPIWKGNKFPTSDSHGKILSEWPDELRVQEFPL